MARQFADLSVEPSKIALDTLVDDFARIACDRAPRLLIQPGLPIHFDKAMPSTMV
jgi:hypothetical protein